MNNHPFLVYPSKQECLISAVVNLTLLTLYCCLEIDIGDGPREVAFDVSFDVRKVKLKIFE